MRLLIDTNIYIEYLLKRENYNDVRSFFRFALTRHNQTYVTAMSLRDIGYVVHRYTHDLEVTKKLQLQVYSMASKVIDISADAAIESLYSNANDYEGSLQLIAAEESMCDAIITFDKKGFTKSKLPVFTPSEILKIWLNEQ